MKTNLFILFMVFTGTLLAQPNTCNNANPFCSSQQYVFPNATGSSAPNGPNYGCLGSQPNPIWYYMEIGTSGTLQLQVSQTGESSFPFFPPGPTDVDFAMWGPFSSVPSGCAAIMSGNTAPIQCSFSGDASETIGIGVQGGYGSGQSTPPAAVAGEIYIVLLTNYEGTTGEITFTQTGGTGSTDCSIVEPAVCSIDNFTATVSACNPATSQYSVTGTISVTEPPSTGQLIVRNCDGIQTTVASAPFNASSYPYNLTGLNPNGAPCSVEVYFSDLAGTCSQVLTYTAPVCPTTSCFFTYLDVTVGACENGNTFTLTGVAEFTDAPTTGQLVVEDCNGNSVAYNPPFISPLNYEITNIYSDGQPCDVTVSFTADPACSINIDYSNTPPCECHVEIGTFTTTATGNSNSTYVLCYGDEILIESNGDYVPPGEALNPPLAAGYNPGIGWAVYSCPPSLALVPHPVITIPDDPCFMGIAYDTDFQDINDLYWINAYPGTFTNNTVYFVPLTMYNMPTYHYSYVNQEMPCYELGTPFPVQYLPPVTETHTADCNAGTLTVTVQGGSPAINGTNFTASGLTPATASLANTTAGNGGTIIVTGLQHGDNYSFEIFDEYGCPIQISGTFEGEVSADISYPNMAYCQNAANPVPVITGTTGGTFSGTAGLVINPSTGVIDLSSTPAGNYTVSYTPPGGSLCSSDATFDLEIRTVPVITASGDVICEGDVAVLNASGASSYFWSPAVGLSATSGATVEAVITSTQTYTVTGIDNATGCEATAQATVFVESKPMAHFTSTPSVTTQFNSLISFQNGSVGATTYFWNFGDGIGTSNEINPVYTYNQEPGSYTVTLIATSPGGCADTVTSVIIIQEELIFYVPNTFTPDQDEYNQVFKPIFASGFDPFDYTLLIFNRWGELIFESHNTEVGWEGNYGRGGTLCQDGTYTWKIEVKTTSTDERKMFTGHINLIR